MDGVRVWVLEVSPKVESKFTYRGRVWVSEDDYGRAGRGRGLGGPPAAIASALLRVETFRVKPTAS